jgi:replicative DNA helicase
MSEMIMRAEQGLLGAMLTDRERQLITAHLTVDDFGHPAHQAVYAALLDLHLVADVPPAPDLVLAMVARDDVNVTLLTTLAASAVEAPLVRPYTQIVLQAAFDRDSIGFAEPYRAAAEQTADPVAAHNLDRLARALAAQAEVFGAGSAINGSGVLTPPAPARVPSLHPEEAIIADLLQHPDQAREIAPWLVSDVFTDAERRLVYELAVSIAYDRDPLDAVVLAWHVQRAHDVNRLWHPSTSTAASITLDYRYLSGLEATVVPAGTAVLIGHELLASQMRATLQLDPGVTAESRPVQRSGPGVEPPPMPTADRTIDVAQIEL